MYMKINIWSICLRAKINPVHKYLKSIFLELIMHRKISDNQNVKRIICIFGVLKQPVMFIVAGIKNASKKLRERWKGYAALCRITGGVQMTETQDHYITKDGLGHLISRY